MSGGSMMDRHGQTTLPCWPSGIVRVVDLTPDIPEPVPLRAGMSIEVSWRDRVFSGLDSRWIGGSNFVRGVLDETINERGERVPIISDALFEAVFPRGLPMPLAIAGYHISFLHRLLGGPWDAPPYLICLYRNARMHFGGITESFEVNDYSLETMACAVDPDRSLELGNGDALSRLQCAEVLTEYLLARSRPNMLVALSVTKMRAPPLFGPFCRDPGWYDMPSDEFLDFE